MRSNALSGLAFCRHPATVLVCSLAVTAAFSVAGASVAFAVDDATGSDAALAEDGTVAVDAGPAGDASAAPEGVLGGPSHDACWNQKCAAQAAACFADAACAQLDACAAKKDAKCAAAVKSQKAHDLFVALQKCGWTACSDPTKASCAGKCGVYLGVGCNCDAGCAQYGDCCQDYVAICSSCKDRCGTAHDGYVCQCDKTCAKLGTCCADKAALCVCVPDCKDRACGDDGCGGICGLCDGAATCTASGKCLVAGADAGAAETAAPAADVPGAADAGVASDLVTADAAGKTAPPADDGGCNAGRKVGSAGWAVWACGLALALRRRRIFA